MAQVLEGLTQGSGVAEPNTTTTTTPPPPEPS